MSIGRTPDDKLYLFTLQPRMRIDAYSRIRTIHTTPTMHSVSSTQILEYGSLRYAIWLQSERYQSEAKRIMTAKVVSR